MIDKLRLFPSAFAKKIYIGIPNKDGRTWKKKANVHSDFLGCMIELYENKRAIIADDLGNKYAVTVTRIGTREEEENAKTPVDSED